jgi:hypothetical protein
MDVALKRTKRITPVRTFAGDKPGGQKFMQRYIFTLRLSPFT